MKAKELINIGYPQGPIIGLMLRACTEAEKVKIPAEGIRSIVQDIFANPSLFVNREIWGEAATELDRIRHPERTGYDFKDKPFTVFGQELIDENTVDQMKNAMRIPVAVAGAIMPDGHVGYSLPIGGVLGTEGAVVPYFVGVDIGCTMHMSVLPIKATDLKRHHQELSAAIKDNTRFGKGVGFDGKNRKNHDVMDEDWNISQCVSGMKDLAWTQLGSQGSGNHFCSICDVTFSAEPEFAGFAGETWLCILSHSGSRGAGNKIATHYSNLAQSLHPNLPGEYKYSAWLDMEAEGIEYWAAMELMSRYAKACHQLAHKGIMRDLKLSPIYELTTNHNMATKEEHGGKQLIVHRKGAVFAGVGSLAIIPGSMATPGYIVRGKGNLQSLTSASHGAGRAMSRKKAKETNRWSQVNGVLKERGVTLLSAGLDEVPSSYKDIELVMRAQNELVQPIARFFPRIVKMSDDKTSED